MWAALVTRHNIPTIIQSSQIQLNMPSSTLKMETKRSSETLVITYANTRRQNPEDRNSNINID
jgi:hypothetical protein